MERRREGEAESATHTRAYSRILKMWLLFPWVRAPTVVPGRWKKEKKREMKKNWNLVRQRRTYDGSCARNSSKRFFPTVAGDGVDAQRRSTVWRDAQPSLAQNRSHPAWPSRIADRRHRRHGRCGNSCQILRLLCTLSQWKFWWPKSLIRAITRSIFYINLLNVEILGVSTQKWYFSYFAPLMLYNGNIRTLI